MNLMFTVFPGRFGLVQPLEGAVMTFIQSPVADNRYPHRIHFVEHDPECPDRSFQYGSIGQIEFETGLSQYAAGCAGLSFAPFGQINVGPARKPILVIPDGLTVTHENYFMHI